MTLISFNELTESEKEKVHNSYSINSNFELRSFLQGEGVDNYVNHNGYYYMRKIDESQMPFDHGNIYKFLQVTDVPK